MSMNCPLDGMWTFEIGAMSSLCSCTRMLVRQLFPKLTRICSCTSNPTHPDIRIEARKIGYLPKWITSQYNKFGLNL